MPLPPNLPPCTPNTTPQPKSYTGLRIAKKFDDVVYLGTVEKYSAPYWEILFDDQDREEWEAWEFASAFELYRRYVVKHGDEGRNIDPKG